MPKYFFNVQYGDDSYVDEVGEDLPDNVAAWHEATVSAGQSIKDLDGRLKPGTHWRMDVLNEAGHAIYAIEVRAQKTI
jgi:hypothetical protein